MTDGTVVTSALIREGLAKLQAETFAEAGLGFGADEVISTSVVQQGMARRHENVFRNGSPDAEATRPIGFISSPVLLAGWKFLMKRF